jgi:hypothetical protein
MLGAAYIKMDAAVLVLILMIAEGHNVQQVENRVNEVGRSVRGSSNSSRRADSESSVEQPRTVVETTSNKSSRSTDSLAALVHYLTMSQSSVAWRLPPRHLGSPIAASERQKGLDDRVSADAQEDDQPRYSQQPHAVNRDIDAQALMLVLISAALALFSHAESAHAQEVQSALVEFKPRGITAQDTIVFVAGAAPFLWATVEFWRRIAVGESFGTGKDSVIINDSSGGRKRPLQRVLGKDAVIAARILFTIAAASGLLVVIAASDVLSGGDGMPSSVDEAVLEAASMIAKTPSD